MFCLWTPGRRLPADLSASGLNDTPGLLCRLGASSRVRQCSVSGMFQCSQSSGLTDQACLWVIGDADGHERLGVPLGRNAFRDPAPAKTRPLPGSGHP